jgi:hypothetical protein
MQLNYSSRTVRQQNRRDPFEFAPPATAVGFAEVRSDFNTGTTRNKFDFADVTDDLKLHGLLMRLTDAG